ncbi:hypothetical protein BO70DRAFT_359651 [Aspergillus heteromorphus CBS 117.55]|uniref:Ferritin-like domain-containing protein n=1 Tax=Aspergillus heteromorphus CBS 117.55 TaxID=1448321 RepID=A0A317WNW3_9EURO|nr:uncharacterized protein BO70DRAFT_359651 [Aspergillus heteromorphus CBS 117.55]PWY88169.1 hypothetical protein BO70DRAFT_359651 [Aspergillus heteromorphus CBS 117.55]
MYLLLALAATSLALPTTNKASADDDILFQNLLAAEWGIYSFYQQGVEAFSAENFTAAGFPNNTYQRITEIRDNEAGHVRIFQDLITDASVKPGPCSYDYDFGNSVTEYLALQTYLEVSSMAFLTGLVRQAVTNDTRSALVAIGQIESRHNAWSLIDVWGVSPFSGPADTTYPYPNHILELTTLFLTSGSCPSLNPVYPNPKPNLPWTDFVRNGTTAAPGAEIQLEFIDGTPAFEDDKEYYVVYFHGVNNISVPFDVTSKKSTIPAEFDPKAGVIIFVVTDEEGAPTEESVLSLPVILLEQPSELTLLI